MHILKDSTLAMMRTQTLSEQSSQEKRLESQKQHNYGT